MFLCLLPLLASCASPDPVMRTRTVYQHLPDVYLLPCPVPYGAATYRGAIDLAERRKAALEECNKQIAAGRQYQADVKAKEGTTPSQ
ncbi:hypothetical protein AchV4_0069 [Achromobacter phage vB_AchrS_AchV4]|uniref:Uncharacterized protein n=1 Tax=Achromobacter phage vB_AchrS_AchV4 TaxID=2796514 RepID=A0A7T3PGY8_9CAUD|nr:Rz-like spanin [Achromobacter phage vB_AchrS_AchV4]QPZ53297.1 hypothetical protein AchV4_0069 [Achromobacter phage vB_AchrS_AchV4]